MSDQANTLRNRILQRHHQAKTIAFASGKGGVGKSNTALNFAIELQKKHQSVLLFDLDIGMGNIDVLLGNRSKYSIVHFFTDYTPIHDMIESGPKELHYIAGGTNLNDLLAVEEHHLERFFQAYNELATNYDYVLFDLGAGLTDTTMAFILAADECFIVTTPEPTAITDAYSVVKQIVRENDHLPIHLLMNRCPNIKAGKRYLQRFEQVVTHFLEKKLASGNVLVDDKAVTTAVMQQVPYVISQPQASISEIIEQIVSTYISENTAQAKPRQLRFVDKLKRLLAVRS